jgi:hypothetical protein
MTTNHSYDTPEPGTLDWHIPLNSNFEKLDTDVEIRDADANKSAYEPKANAKFFATDTKKVYVGDGSAWTHVGDVAKLPGDVYVQSTEPSNPVDGDIWIQTG